MSRRELLTWGLSKEAAATLEMDMADQKLAKIDCLFTAQFGMPVLDNEERCFGVVSMKAWPWPPTGHCSSFS
jgi:hypothetical protein